MILCILAIKVKSASEGAWIIADGGIVTGLAKDKHVRHVVHPEVPKEAGDGGVDIPSRLFITSMQILGSG